MYFEYILNIILVIYLGRSLYYLTLAIESKEKDRIKYQVLFFSITLLLALLIKFVFYP